MAIWSGSDARREVNPTQVLRARALELRMNPKGDRETSDEGQVEQCVLCGSRGNWYHMCSVCKHEDIRNFYTVRHHSTGKILRKSVKEGKLAKFYILTSFGRTNGEAEDITVPDWMLAKDTKLTITAKQVTDEEGETVRCGINPDMVILKGWPSTETPPTEPVQTHSGESITLMLAEHACTSDLKPSRVVERKKLKYRELVLALREAGWRVQDEVIVTTVGVRGTVPLANDEALQKLGVHEKATRRWVQTAMARDAIIHLNRIVRQYRILAKRLTNRRNPAETRKGVG